jgi:hypothetical protein
MSREVQRSEFVDEGEADGSCAENDVDIRH